MNEREIFQQAIELTSLDERRTFLDQACGGDAALRLQVEALLRAHDASGDFLQRPAIGPFDESQLNTLQPTSIQEGLGARGRDTFNENKDASGAVPAGEHGNASASQRDLSYLQPPLQPGSLGALQHYDVQSVLGEGAFGIVFKAFDTKLLRHVAIKVLSPQLATTSPPRQRFLREARAAAGVGHENVVQVYGVEEQPLPFLIMELVSGPTLQHYMNERGPLPLREVLILGQQLANGLAAAHARGLIHRDVKPGNILVVFDPQPKAKITDFGLARAADDASLTRSGYVCGTPMYMSPEQARGEPLDQRSDLFSLGSVLYQMASGRPPFRASSSVAVLHRVVHDAPRPVREVVAEVPEWLDTIIARLHQKDVDQRSLSARELAELLGDCATEWSRGERLAPETLAKIQRWAVESPTHAGHDETPLAAGTRVAPQLEQSPPAPAIPIAPRSRATVFVGIAAAALIGIILWYALVGHRRPDGSSDEIAAGSAEHTASRGRNDDADNLSANDLQETKDRAGTTSGASAPQRSTDSASAPTSPDHGADVSDGAEWRALKTRALAARELASNEPEAATVRWKLHQFARLNANTPSGDAAFALLQSLRWPVDELRRESIPAASLQSAGFGDAAKEPAELVALYGDERWKHWGPVTAVASSSDGRLVASAGFDLTVLVWDAATGRRLHTFLLTGDMDLQRSVTALAFSPNHTRLAGTSHDGYLRVWDLASGKLMHESERQEHGFLAVEFSSDGNRLLTSDVAGMVRQWDAATGKVLKQLQTGSQLTWLARAVAGDRLAVVTERGVIRILNETSLEIVSEDQPAELGDPVSAIALSPDGRQLAVGTSRGTILVWNVAERTVVRELAPSKMKVTALAFDDEGRKMGVATINWELYTVDATTGRTICMTHLHSNITSLAARPASRQWIVGWGNHWITFVEHQQGKIENPDFGPIHGFDPSWDGRLVAAAHRESSRLTVWEVARPTEFRHLTTTTEWDEDIVFAPEGQRLISVGGNWLCKLWNPADGSFVASFNRHENWIWRAEFHPDGARVATGSADRRGRINNVMTRQIERVLDGHHSDVWHVRFSRDGRLVASASGDGSVIVRTVDTGEIKLQLGGRGPATSTAFRPDGRVLLTIHLHEALLWSADTGALLHSLKGHESFIEDGDISPDGRLVATSGHDGTVRLWNSESGQALRTIRFHPTHGKVLKIRFSPEGRHLWLRNGNGTLSVLRIAELQA